MLQAARRECRRVDAAPGIKYDAAPTFLAFLPNDFSALGQPALNTQNEEIEVKFVLDDLAAMRRRVVDMGAVLKTPRTYESNVTYDTVEGRLRQDGRLLRLRRDRRNVLTYKEPLAHEDADFKVRREFEVEVSDFAQAQAIVERLGFAASMRYEKYRETFTYAGAEIVLDELPVGNFMEIEATREQIRGITAALGLDFAARLRSSYGDILEAVCAAYDLPLSDMTFDNFRHLTVDLHACDLT